MATTRKPQSLDQPVAQPPPSPASEQNEASPQVEIAKPCGEKGQPDCPLQAWMRRNMDEPLEAADFARLATAYARVAELAPDATWNAGAQGWATIAESGAAAAKNGDLSALQQTCKSCHRGFRSKYKQSFRPRPLPK